MTPADKDALERMPDGWFRPCDLPFIVRSPDYRCQRLLAAGMLVSRFTEQAPYVWTEYSKTTPPVDGNNRPCAGEGKP